MAFATMVRSNAAPHTEGYGNTRDSLAATGDRIADNDICEGDFRERMAKILRDTDRVRAGQKLGTFWKWYLSHFESGSKDWHAGQDRLFAMLNGITRGRIDLWLGFVSFDDVCRAGKRKK